MVINNPGNAHFSHETRTTFINFPLALTPMEKEEQEQKYELLQLLDQQLKQTQKQIKTMRVQQENLIDGMRALDELDKVPTGSEILVPITGGVFLKATLVEKDTVTVNIGAQTAVQKSRKDARGLLEEQFKEIESVVEQLANDFKELYVQAQKIQGEVAQ